MGRPHGVKCCVVATQDGSATRISHRSRGSQANCTKCAAWRGPRTSFSLASVKPNGSGSSKTQAPGPGPKLAGGRAAATDSVQSQAAATARPRYRRGMANM